MKFLLYALLATGGIALYIEAYAYATAWRGYMAHGGEVFILFIPIFAAYKTIQHIFRIIRKDDHHV